jgi:hypothetical protein
MFQNLKPRAWAVVDLNSLFPMLALQKETEMHHNLVCVPGSRDFKASEFKVFYVFLSQRFLGSTSSGIDSAASSAPLTERKV